MRVHVAFLFTNFQHLRQNSKNKTRWFLLLSAINLLSAIDIATAISTDIVVTLSIDIIIKISTDIVITLGTDIVVTLITDLVVRLSTDIVFPRICSCLTSYVRLFSLFRLSHRAIHSIYFMKRFVNLLSTN